MSGSIIQVKCETIKRELKGLLRRYCQAEPLRPGFAVERFAQLRGIFLKRMPLLPEYVQFIGLQAVEQTSD